MSDISLPHCRRCKRVEYDCSCSDWQIGDTITATYRGQQITGRIVGKELSEYRRGFPTTGYVLTVDVGKGEWVQIHSRDVVNAAE